MLHMIVLLSLTLKYPKVFMYFFFSFSSECFQVVKITLCYWTEKIPGQSKKYPTFCDFGIDKPDGFTEPVYVFGFPSIEYNGLRKVRNFSKCGSEKIMSEQERRRRGIVTYVI